MRLLRSHKGVRDRILSIDTMRGCAMILIIFSHTKELIYKSQQSGMLWVLLTYVTNISTVAFAFINGVMLNYFFFQAKSFDRWEKTYWRFVKRAFLLFACFPLMKVLAYPAYTWIDWHTYFWMDHPITNTIAICLLVSPWITRYTSSRTRFLLILAILIFCPAVVVLWRPDSLILLRIKQLFFGDFFWSGEIPFFPFAIFPWLAVDLCGSFLGESLARAKKGEVHPLTILKQCQKWGVGLIGAGLASIGLYKTIKFETFKFRIDQRTMDWFEVYYPGRTTFLLLVYLGMMLLLFSYLFKNLDLKGKYNRIVWFPSIFGRTSLFTFVLQWGVTMGIPALWGVKEQIGLGGVITATLISTIVCWALAVFYGTLRGWISPDDYSEIKAKGGRVFGGQL